MKEQEKQAVEAARRRLERIAEKIESQSYWNAIYESTLLTQELTQAFDSVLKGYGITQDDV